MGELFLAGKKTLRTLVDFESFVSLQRDGNHLTLSVEAELRPTYGRAETMPLVCNIQFLFDETPQVTARYEVLPTGNGSPDSAFEFRFRTDREKHLTLHPAGTILPGNRYGMNVRFDASGAETPAADAKAEVAACTGPRPDLIAGCFTWNSLRNGKTGARNDDFPEGVALTHDFRSYPVFRNGESALEMRYPDDLPVGGQTVAALRHAREQECAECRNEPARPGGTPAARTRVPGRSQQKNAAENRGDSQHSPERERHGEKEHAHQKGSQQSGLHHSPDDAVVAEPHGARSQHVIEIVRHARSEMKQKDSQQNLPRQFRSAARQKQNRHADESGSGRGDHLDDVVVQPGRGTAADRNADRDPADSGKDEQNDS